MHKWEPTTYHLHIYKKYIRRSSLSGRACEILRMRVAHSGVLTLGISLRMRVTHSGVLTLGINLRMRVTHSGVLTLGINLNKNVIRYVVELINMSTYVYVYGVCPPPMCGKHKFKTPHNPCCRHC